MIDSTGMSLVRIASVEDVPEGAVREFKYGEATYALCNRGGQIRAYQGLCPHRNGPLGHGNLFEGRIVCPWHAWEFHCDTGQYDYDPRIRLRGFPVEIRDGAVWLRPD